MIAPGTEFELDVDRVAHGGHCVGRHEGRVVFVRHALPGERVRVQVTDGGDESRFLRADAVGVIEPSPDRVTPPCAHAAPGGCGGCDWQHALLPAQRALKASVVREQLTRLAGLDRDVVVEELAGSPDGLGWRTRVRFAVASDGSLGFRRHRSHDIETVASCPLAHPHVTASGVTRTTYVGADEVLVAVAATPPVPAAGADGEPAAVLVRDHEGAIIERRGPERLMNVVDGRVFASAPDGFWQVHPAAASTLVEAVLSNVEVRAGETVWDLYAGAGLFSASLARHAGPAGTVIAVEGSAAAAADARTNLDGVPGVRVERARVDRWLQGERDRPDVVVLDPPRKGATRAVVGPVAHARPRVVAYVACDPAALARDVALFAAAGYELDVLRAFDLFPMTHHVECVAILRPTVR